MDDELSVPNNLHAITGKKKKLKKLKTKSKPVDSIENFLNKPMHETTVYDTIILNACVTTVSVFITVILYSGLGKIGEMRKR